MSKVALAAVAAAIFMAQGAMAQDGAQWGQLPEVSNVAPQGGMERRVERMDPRAEMRADGLTEGESIQLDQIASAAAARAVIALRCEGSSFEGVSKAVQRTMEDKAAQAASNPQAARAYARDSALMKYKAIAQANSGVPCGELGNLRGIAASQGFD